MQFSWFNLAVILFLGAGVLFGLAPLIGATLLAPRSKGGDIGLPYECGITPHGPARVRFDINYYFYALLFLAFDVDVLYLFPVAALPGQPRMGGLLGTCGLSRHSGAGGGLFLAQRSLHVAAQSDLLKKDGTYTEPPLVN